MIEWKTIIRKTKETEGIPSLYYLKLNSKLNMKCSYIFNNFFVSTVLPDVILTRYRPG